MINLIKKYKLILCSVFVLLMAFVLFIVQIAGINLTLNNEDYISAAMDIKDILPTAPASSYSKIVIIIDDLGQNREGVKEMLEINATLTMAIMPFSEKSTDDALAAHNAGHEVILHIPFYTNKVPSSWLGKRYITNSTTKEEFKDYLNDALNEIPMAKGINNHIGPMGCDNPSVINNVLSCLSEKNMFLIDSATSIGSSSDNSAYNLSFAHDMQDSVLMRNFFLDGANNPSVDAVKKQIKKAAVHAHENGLAVVIGHVGTEGGHRTAQAISEMLPWLAENNVYIVGASELIL